MNAVERNRILDADAIKRKLRRTAFQILEDNADEKELVIAGINGKGEIVARSIIKALNDVSSLRLHYLTVHLNKKQPLDASVDDNTDLNGKVIILVDDVANSGRTMLYALKPFLQYSPKKIQTLVLVERSHKLFPLHTDYVGLSLSTTLQEHIEVETESDEITGAWLQ